MYLCLYRLLEIKKGVTCTILVSFHFSAELLLHKCLLLILFAETAHNKLLFLRCVQFSAVLQAINQQLHFVPIKPFVLSHGIQLILERLGQF
jgi:hypothetical protein